MTAHGELDLSEIDAMDLPDEVKEHLRHAWIEADGIRKKFVPEHIWGWLELLERIEDIRRSARIHAVMFGGMDSSILNEDLSVRRILWNRFRSVGPLCAILGGIIALVSAVMMITTWNELWLVPTGVGALIMFGGGGLVIFQREKRIQTISLSSHGSHH